MYTKKGPCQVVDVLNYPPKGWFSTDHQPLVLT